MKRHESTLERDWTALIHKMRETRDAGQGAEAAFTELYRRSSPLVYGLVLHILRDEGAAEETTLDVYLQVWHQAADYDFTRGSPATWILMLARSRAIDSLRRNVRRERFLEETLEQPAVGANGDHSDGSELHDERRRVHAALARIAPEERRALECAFFLGLSHAQIAEHLDEPLGTVKTRIRAGISKLRQSLQSFAGDQRP